MQVICLYIYIQYILFFKMTPPPKKKNKTNFSPAHCTHLLETNSKGLRCQANVCHEDLPRSPVSWCKVPHRKHAEIKQTFSKYRTGIFKAAHLASVQFPKGPTTHPKLKQGTETQVYSQLVRQGRRPLSPKLVHLQAP